MESYRSKKEGTDRERLTNQQRMNNNRQRQHPPHSCTGLRMTLLTPLVIISTIIVFVCCLTRCIKVEGWFWQIATKETLILDMQEALLLPHLPHTTSNHNTTTTTSSSRRSNGVSFTRNFNTDFPNSVEFDLHFLPSSHCSSHDKYGDNDCLYPWGTSLTANYSFASPSPDFHVLDDKAQVVGTFHLDSKIPWQFDCVLCGQDCELKVPVIDLSYSYKMPPCPIKLPTTAKSYQRTFNFWKYSPTHGLITTKLEGHVVIYKDITTSDVLTSVDVSIDIK